MSKFIFGFFVSFCVWIIPSLTIAQLVPAGISYQGILRSADGSELPNQPVTIVFAVRQGAADGTIVFEENHSLINTNQFGLFNAIIGSGVYTGIGIYTSLTSIPWESGPYFMEVRAGIPGQGNPYVIGVTQLMTVPYSMFASEANTVLNEGDGDPFNEVITGVSISGDQLVIEEGDSSFGIDISLLQGAGDTDNTNELITSAGLNGMQLEITEGSNSTSVDLSDVAYNTWSRSGNVVYNTNDRIGIATSQPQSTLDVNGSMSVPLRIISVATDTLDAADFAVICNVTANSILLRLPDASMSAGRMYKVRKLFSGVSTSNTVTLSPLVNGQTIDLSPGFVLDSPTAEYATLISDGFNWYILDHSKE